MIRSHSCGSQAFLYENIASRIKRLSGGTADTVLRSATAEHGLRGATANNGHRRSASGCLATQNACTMRPAYSRIPIKTSSSVNVLPDIVNHIGRVTRNTGIRKYNQQKIRDVTTSRQANNGYVARCCNNSRQASNRMRSKPSPSPSNRSHSPSNKSHSPANRSRLASSKSNQSSNHSVRYHPRISDHDEQAIEDHIVETRQTNRCKGTSGFQAGKVYTIAQIKLIMAQ